MKQLLFLFLLFQVFASEAQILKVGTMRENPPFSSTSDQKGNLFGFDIDIMGEVCKRMKVTCHFSSGLYPDLFTTLLEHKVDVSIGGIVITVQQEQDFLFSIPYLESSGQFVTKGTSAINLPKELENKRVGLSFGRLFERIIRKIYNNHLEFVTFPNNEALMTGLSDGTVDAVFMNAATAKFWVANNSTDYKLIGSPVPTGAGYGIVANKGQETLIGAINQALLQMEADGTYLKIYTRYFGG